MAPAFARIRRSWPVPCTATTLTLAVAVKAGPTVVVGTDPGERLPATGRRDAGARR